MQPIEFLPWAVALYPRESGIDHEMNARHRQRGFGDIGRQHDAPLRAGIEHTVLIARRQSCIQRQHFGMAILALLQRLVRIANLALARKKNQHIAHRRLADDLVAGGHDAVEHAAVAVALAIVLPIVLPIARTAATTIASIATFELSVLIRITARIQRPIAHFDRITAAFHVDHRCVIEMLRKALGVDGGRGDDHFQIAAFD